MNSSTGLTKEETIEVGKEVRSMRSVFLKIIGLSMIPLVVMGIATCLISNISERKLLEEEIRKELHMAAYGLEKSYSVFNTGDFTMKDDGFVYKGDMIATGRLSTISDELLKNGIVCTFFYKDTRVETTVVDATGTSMAGTKLNGSIYRTLCESGDVLFCEAVDLGGRTYYGYYIPYRNSNGEVSTIFFAGKLRSDVMNSVWEVTVTILWIGLVVLVIGVIVSLLCSIYMVGVLFRHFKEEDEQNGKKLAAKSQMEFMTLINREVRDPVDSITVLSDKILEEESAPDVREKVLGIKEAINSMLISFDSISEYSKTNSGELSNEKDEYELTKLVDGCCSKVSPGIERKKLDFRVVYDESTPNYLKGDYGKIRQILDNLLENAVKYTSEGSVRLEIGYRNITPDKVDVSFTISDTGIGIRKEDAEKLFYSIGKVGEIKNISIKGTGLGLLICKRLVTILDGRISAESEIGKGSTFRFTIPQDVLNRKTVGECK